MTKTEDPELGICYECSTKDRDSAKKVVYHCGICKKWFCALHLKPKFPYIVDWETQFDVQGDPAVKAFFYSEYRREDGHPDFVYLQQMIERIESEKKIHNQMIEKNIDKMVEANWKRVPEIPTKKSHKVIGTGMTETTENTYGYKFVVPKEVYSNPEYREYLNHAQSMKSVKVIVDEYRKKFGDKEYFKELSKSMEKKHWWQ
jgi:hypothetical protein